MSLVVNPPGLASRASAKVASVAEITLCLDRFHLYLKSDPKTSGWLWKTSASLALAEICIQAGLSLARQGADW